MKFLLVITMIVGSAFAHAANNEWEVKCFEKRHGDFDLAYIIKVDRNHAESLNSRLELEDCTRRGHGDMNSEECRERGDLKKIERQNETCLVLDRDHHENITNDNFKLCYQQQETLTNPRRLVPVTVTDDRQESRIYCERELLRIL